MFEIYFLLYFSLGGVDTHALVPFADMLNHDRTERNSDWKYNQQTNTFQIIATKSIRKQQQIVDSYG
jgi:hypothetical protein